MPNDVKTYDLIIVGAGSGNMIPVPEMEGWNLAIVEPDKFGGTCLNRGCIPSKMLLYAAQIVESTWQGAASGTNRFLSGFKTLTFQTVLWLTSSLPLYRRARAEGSDFIGQGETSGFVNVSYPPALFI